MVARDHEAEDDYSADTGMANVKLAEERNTRIESEDSRDPPEDTLVSVSRDRPGNTFWY